MTVQNARKTVQKLLAEMSGGDNPNQIKAEQRAKSITLGEAADIYLSDSKIKPATAKQYE